MPPGKQLPASEAIAMDPHQRLWLEVGFEALHQSGAADKAALAESSVGVFAGMCCNDFAHLDPTFQRGPHGGTGARLPFFDFGEHISAIIVEFLCAIPSHF